jgi:tetratricopeptide (TPR) repeat protein
VQPALTELGLLLRTSDPDQALSYYRRSHDLLVAAHGEADGDAAVLLGNIGSIHRRAHRYQEAKEAYERALPHLKHHFGERDPHVASVLGNLSIVYRSLGDYAQAIEMAQQALAVDTAVSGADHPDVGVAWQNLAVSTDTLGDTRAALEQIDRAIEIFGQRLPPAHPLRIQAANVKAGFLIELGQLTDARKTLGDPAEGESGSVEARRSVLKGLVIRADIERLDKKWEEAQALAERVLVDPAVRGDQFLEADARWAHAYTLAAQAKTADAEAERMRALELETASAAGTPFPGVFTHAKYYVCAGDTARALAILREAVGKGFNDPMILHDPAFATLRKRADFQPIAAAVAPRGPLAPAALQ